MEEIRKVEEEVIPEEMIRPAKKNRIIYVLLAMAVILILILLAGIRFCIIAKETGGRIGNRVGSAAGIAVGSFDGITRGLAEGYEDGQEQGLSAKDTDVVVANEMMSVGRLDVLVAQDQLIDDFREGNDYKALFVYKTQAVFYVDLENIDISVNEDHLQAVIPKPECEFEIDENESEKLVEWQKHFWSGSTETGYIGYMNSMGQIRNKAASEMSNYDVLMKQAETSAKKQVETLVKSVTGNRFHVEVVFEGEEQENE